MHPWLHAYLTEHVAWWAAAHGLEIDAARHVDTHGLVDADWLDLLRTGPDRLADLALRAGEPAGVVQAEVREDRWLRSRVGVVSWIAVAPGARGAGLAAELLDHALAWMHERGAASAEVFVTAANAPAVAAYARAGFAVVDHRMIRALVSPRSPGYAGHAETPPTCLPTREGSNVA